MSGKAKIWTWAVVGSAILLVVGYDAVVATNDIEGDTISEMALNWAMTRHWAGLAVGFVAGVLAGHFWWPQKIKGD